MKINFNIGYGTKQQNFKGVREDRNTVAQLKENNNYSLTEPNQRRINKAIENLAKQRGEENIKFLLSVGENLKYQTNIKNNGIEVKNDWASKLKTASEESLYHSNPLLKDKYQSKIDDVFSQKPLNKDELYLNKTKNSLVRMVKGYSDEAKIKKDLEYFIESTETPIEHKKYVMKRLNYFMSDKYKINPQLQDKKPQILSEIANDIALNTLDKDIPNTKAVNQKTHGMCAAISIVRKAVAYEDKPNFVDAVLSELDDSDKVMIYDKQKLGSGKRIPVNKTYINFDYAQERGYRIIDASTLQWMNIGGMYGAQNESLQEFNAFDKNNFDAFHDSFFAKNFEDKDLLTKQAYYQALTKAEDDIKSLKLSEIKKDVKNLKNRSDKELNIEKLQKLNKEIRQSVNEIAPDIDQKTNITVVSDVMKLIQPISSDINKLPKNLQKFAFIPNEEFSQKQNKVEQYFIKNYGTNKINKDKLLENSAKLVENLEDIQKTAQAVNPSKSMSSKIVHARRLYEAEAGYRASITIGLMDKDIRTDWLVRHNLPDRETRISQGFDKAIEKIEKNNDKKLLNHFAPYFNTTPQDKEGILEGLTSIKSIIDYMLTDGLDSQYNALGFGSRNEMIVNELNDSIERIQNNDKGELDRSAACLQIKSDDKQKKSKVIAELTNIKNKLEEQPQNNEFYIEAINKMGYKDQMDMFIDTYNIFSNGISEDSMMRDVMIERFKTANNMDENTPVEDIVNALKTVGENFNHISETISGAGNMLEVENDDGTPYFTINATLLILDSLEKEGDLIPQKTMKKLQSRFAKIDKLRSSDEFSSRQGKISDPSLYKLSKEESDGIKQINKNLNKMYSFIKREKNYQYRQIKEPLAQLAQYVGNNSGKYWFIKEGSSGLFNDQEIKIFDEITDRPHKEVEDIEEAVDIIKNTPHSGISGSHVFHDKYGSHAMYVADVITDKKTGKDIILHDNSWGPSEHENVWIDSNGNMRTDYSDHRGGELGYITNKDWRNGNFVENLTHKKGHINSDDTESKLYKKLNPTYHDEDDFMLMRDIILEGKSTNYRDIAGAIKDEIFIPDAPHIKTLEKHAKKMTKREIQAAIFRNNSLRDEYLKNFNKIIKQITPNKFNKGITTEEEYNNLPDNSPVKIAFEKAAIRNSFEDATMYKELGKARTMDEVRAIKEKQRARAKDDFYYTFNKNDAKNNVFLAAAFNHGEDFSDALTSVTKKYGIKADADTLGEVLHNVALFEKDEKKQYDGSVRNSIEIFLDKASKQFDKNLGNFENSEQAKEEFLHNLRQVYEKNIYFDKEDLKLDTAKQKGIRMWIDDTFEPKTDEEFISIFRMLQDMNKDEFNKYTKNLNDKYLGMKEVSGFELLKRVQNANSNATDLLRNTIYYDTFANTINISNTQESFKYKKLERNHRGAYYKGERTFDDLYRTFSYALSTLEYEKLFNKYKDENFRNYGAIPAYPKIDLNNDPVMNEKIQTTKDLVDKSFNTISEQKNYIYDINLAHIISDYRDSIPKDRPLNNTEKKVLTKLTGDFISANLTDNDMEDALNSAYELLEMDDKATIADYNDYIDTIVNTIRLMESVNTVKDFEDANRAHAKGIREYFNSVLNSNIPPRYHRILKEDINNWLELEKNSRKQHNAIDKNREIMELQIKIADKLTSSDKKGMLEGFIEITDALNQAKADNYDKKRDIDNINSQIQNLHKISDKYLGKYVEPDAIPVLRANFNDLYRKELLGEKKPPVTEEQLEDARNKFEDDFRKHHITSHPSEVLDNFLLLTAKDATPQKQRKTYKSYLETELNLAKFISIQDSLIEAVQSGNAAEVKDYFDEYDVDIYNSGNSVSMNSDAAIDYMVRSLLVNDDNPETAKMFVEKLGLGERVMKIERQTIKEINPKEKVDEIAKTLNDAYDLTNTASDVYLKLIKEVDNISNIEELNKAILKTRREIVKALEFSDDEGSVNKLLEPLDEFQEFILKKPNVTKSAVLASSLSSAINDVNATYNAKIKDTQQYIDIINLIYRFLEDIQLPEYSKGCELQKQIEKEHDELTEYNNKVLYEAANQHPGAQITTK